VGSVRVIECMRRKAAHIVKCWRLVFGLVDLEEMEYLWSAKSGIQAALARLEAGHPEEEEEEEEEEEGRWTVFEDMAPVQPQATVGFGNISF